MMQEPEAEGSQARPMMPLENNSVKALAAILIPSTFGATQWSSISPLMMDLIPFGKIGGGRELEDLCSTMTSVESFSLRTQSKNVPFYTLTLTFLILSS